MSYDITEIRDGLGRVVREILTCRHDDATPVHSGGKVVAHLCPDCDRQLPVEWNQ